MRVITLITIFAVVWIFFSLSTICTNSPSPFNSLSGAISGQYIAVGGFTGSALSPLPSVLLLSPEGGLLYQWVSRGMILSSREINGSFILSGYGGSPGEGVEGLVLYHDKDKTKSFRLKGSTDIFLSDATYHDGAIMVAGYFAQTPRGDLDVLVARFNLEGRLLGLRCYGSVDYPDIAKRLIFDGENIMVLGETWAYNVSQGDVLLLKVRDDLTLVDSWSIGGAGIDSGEDVGVTRNGDYVIVGYTMGGEGTQGFLLRVSRIGGILWLRGYLSLGETYLKRVYVDPDTGRVYIVGSGVFEEGRKDPFLLVEDEIEGWIFNESRLEIVRSEPSLDLTGDIGGKHFFLYYPGGIIAGSLKGDVAVNYQLSGPSINSTLFLDDTSELSYYSKSIYGWRLLRGVVKERPCPKIQVVETDPKVSQVSVSTSTVKIERKAFKREFDPGLALRRILERNVPLVLLLPVFIVFLLVIYYALRGSILKRD